MRLFKIKQILTDYYLQNYSIGELRLSIDSDKALWFKSQNEANKYIILLENQPNTRGVYEIVEVFI